MQGPLKAYHLTKLKSLFSDDYIPFLGGRPDRETHITPGEIIDLKIDLHTTRSVDEFLNLLRHCR